MNLDGPEGPKLLSPRIYFVISLVSMFSFFYIRAVVKNIPAFRLPYEISVPFMAGLFCLFLYLIETSSSKSEKIIGGIGLYFFGTAYLTGLIYELFM